MNCHERKHDIVLYLYGELDDEARQETRGHLNGCTQCQQFHDRERKLQLRLTEDLSEWELPADLLVECRRDLSNELDRLDEAAERRAFWKIPNVMGVLSRIRLLESAALVSMGLALGVYVTNGYLRPIPGANTPSVATSLQNASVTNLRIVTSDPESGRVELAGEMVQPMRLAGHMNDEEVQQLLVGVLQSPSNPGVRLRAVELLAQNPRDPDIKEVLVGTLLNDDNAGVRLYALQALQAFSEEEEVRQALKYVLATDGNPGIRVQAIEALAPLTEEEAMDAVIQEAVREDPNEYVRMRELQFVGTGN